MGTEGLGHLKNFSARIGTRTRDLLSGCAVPQPAVPPLTPQQFVIDMSKLLKTHRMSGDKVLLQVVTCFTLKHVCLVFRCEVCESGRTEGHV
jgi:hypothetical protein